MDTGCIIKYNVYWNKKNPLIFIKEKDPWTWARLLWRMSLAFFNTLFFITLRLSIWVLICFNLSTLTGCLAIGPFKEEFFCRFSKVCHFDYFAFALCGKVWIPYNVSPQQLDECRHSNWPSYVGPYSLCNLTFWRCICHVPFRTCICSNVETILSWTCHVYGPFGFRTSLRTSMLLCFLLFHWWRGFCHRTTSDLCSFYPLERDKSS